MGFSSEKPEAFDDLTSAIIWNIFMYLEPKDHINFARESKRNFNLYRRHLVLVPESRADILWYESLDLEEHKIILTEVCQLKWFENNATLFESSYLDNLFYYLPFLGRYLRPYRPSINLNKITHLIIRGSGITAA